MIPDPIPGPRDIVISSRAWSINYRDLAMPHGGYPRNDKVKRSPPLIPFSDVAGEVVEVGSEVSDFRLGDRVMASFFRDWIDGGLTSQQIDSALGGAIDGVLSEKVCLPEQCWVRIPGNYSYGEAATLPCAGVTAWHALTAGGITTGQSVLLLGTGGVSLFALQLAQAAGAWTIITSSSDEKLRRVSRLGADETINYSTVDQWHERVLTLTNGRGVDHVIEVGGAGTLSKSLAAVRVGGTISLIGVLSGRIEKNPSILPALFRHITIRGIYAGSRRMLEELVTAVEVNDIHPVIDRSFAFDEARGAYEYLKSGKHVGKLVIEAS